MKALVTGATGFLGSHITERLVQRGDEVLALVRPASDTSLHQELGVQLTVGDVTDASSLRDALRGVDVVYHAAATVTDWAPWSEFETATVHGTRNVFEAAEQTGVPRILHVSTDGVYALSALRGTITEDSPFERRFGWFDYYRRAKLAAEKTARLYASSGKIAVTIVRPGLIMGERDRAIFPGTAEYLKSKSAVYLGPGNNVLPFVYAGDVADACIRGATEGAGIGRIYNVASDEPVTQRRLFTTIADAIGVRPPSRSLPIPAIYSIAFLMEMGSILRRRKQRPEITRFGVLLLALSYREDTTRIRNELGWQPTVTLREAIQRTIESRSKQTQRARS